MTRTKLILGVSSLLSVVAYASIALTQTPDSKPEFKSRPELKQPTGPKPVYLSPQEVYPPRLQRPGTGVPSPTNGDPSASDDDTYELLPRQYSPSGTVSINGAPPVPIRTRTYTRQVRETVVVPMTAEEIKQLKEFQQAKQKLKDARDDAARKAATDVIQKQLAKEFDQDLTQRETDLAAVEERVKLLRKQLERRKVARDEIISLRLKTIVNNAEGLGFPGDEDASDDSSIPGPVMRPPGTVPRPTFDPNEEEFRPRKSPPPFGDQPPPS